MGEDPDTVARWQATLRALRLRRAGMAYTAISIAMLEYHGIDLPPEHWRHACRKAGAPPCPRGLKPAGSPRWQKAWA